MEHVKTCQKPNPTPPMLINEIFRLMRTWMNHDDADPMQAQHSCHMILRKLNRMEGCTQPDLVNATNLKPPTVSVTLKKLEASGYVLRKPDAHDLRAIRVFLTDKGRAFNEALIGRCHMAGHIMMENIPTEDIETVIRVLTRMRTNMLTKLESEPSAGHEAE